MVMALTWFALLSPASAAEPATENKALIASLDELERAINAKIERDLDTIAFAYWSAFEIRRARRLADWIMTPVEIIKSAVDIHLLTAGVGGIRSRIERARSMLELATLMAGFMQAHEGVERLLLSGQEIGDALNVMLKSASTHPRDAEAFQAVIRHYLEYGAASPIALATPNNPGATDPQKLVRGISEVQRAFAAELARLKADFAASPHDPAAAEQTVSLVRELTQAVKRSAGMRQEVSLAGDVRASTALSLGGIAELNRTWTEALGNYDHDMKIEQIASVISIADLGISYLTISTSHAGGAAMRTAKTVATVLDLGSFAFEYTFTTDAREQVNSLPHEMVLALAPELANMWRLVRALESTTRGQPEVVPAASAVAPDAAHADQVEITMSDGSVLKGQLAPARIPFVSGYGAIEVTTSAITSFAGGWLALEDGSALRGAFGEGDVGLTTSQGTLRIPAREIAAMSRSGTSEATAAKASQAGEEQKRVEALAQRLGRWFVGLERPVAAFETKPSEATWASLVDYLRQIEPLQEEVVAAGIGQKVGKRFEELFPAAQALETRLNQRVHAPLLAAAKSGDWRAVEIWADRILQLNPQDAEARSLKDKAVAARPAGAPSSAGAAAEPAPTETIVGAWRGTVDQPGELTKEKALELVRPIASRLAPTPSIAKIDLSTSKNFWSSIFLPSLGHCWAQPDGSYPVLTTAAPIYARDAPEYRKAGYHVVYKGPFDVYGRPMDKDEKPYVYLRSDGPYIKNECKDFIKGVWMWPTGNPSGTQYYPQVLYVVAYRSEFDGVRSVLSREGQAEVKVAFTWKPTDFLNELRRVDAAAIDAAPLVERRSNLLGDVDPGGMDWFPSGRDRTDVVRTVRLIEYDQGWRVVSP